MMNESELYHKYLKPLFKKQNIFICRVEAPKIPDVYITKNGNSLWGEIKCVNKESDIIRPNWRPGQLAWIKENARYGSKNICLILYYNGITYFLEPKEYYYKEELKCQLKNYLKILNR